MIDYVDFRITGTDVPNLGKELKTSHPSGACTVSFTDVKVRPDKHAPDFHIQIEAKKGTTRLWGCPLKWLQGHNGMGTNDLRALVAASVPLVFATLQRPCPQFILDAVTTGTYEILEVHIAELHRMPHELIGSFCDHIRRYAPKELQAAPLEEGKGIGVRLWPNSRDRRIVLYDKVQYYVSAFRKHKLALLGHLPSNTFERHGTSAAFDKMLHEHLSQGIRIESRLQRLLKTRNLNYGHAWTANTARQLHLDVLANVPLADAPFPAELEALLLEPMPVEDRRIMTLWIDGRSIRDYFGSAPAYYRCREKFSEKYHIDLSATPLHFAGLDWCDLIAEEAILETPEWAIESKFVFDPATYSIDDGRTHLEKAWLA